MSVMNTASIHAGGEKSPHAISPSVARHMVLFHTQLKIIIIRLGLNVALTHQNRSHYDSETKENVEAQKMKQRGGNDRKEDSDN